jgi:uncharacterized membrane protein
MKALREHAVAVLFVIASFAVVFVLYDRMPDPVPTHWNAHGVANGFTPKPWGPFIGPLIGAALTAVLIGLPAIAPKDGRLERFGRAYRLIVAAMAGFILFVTMLTSLAAIGVELETTNLICAGVGVLFTILGNVMGKVTRNYFVGIRTPWTLANDEVWLRTHRLGAKLFVLGGLVAVAGALFGHGFGALMVGVAGATLVPVVYSYVIYRRIVG